MPTSKSAKKNLSANKPEVRKKAVPRRKAITAKKPPDRKKLPRVKTGANGRPTDFREEYVQCVFDLCLLGFTDAQLSEVFSVSEVTLRSWKKKHPDFLVAMRMAKAIADAKVAYSLYNRAIGITVEEWREAIDKEGQVMSLKTTKQIPGDIQAMRFWLKNRQPSLWKENISLTDGEGNGFSLIINECLKPPTRPPEER
jgi:hypothetical protein